LKRSRRPETGSRGPEIHRIEVAFVHHLSGKREDGPQSVGGQLRVVFEELFLGPPSR